MKRAIGRYWSLCVGLGLGVFCGAAVGCRSNISDADVDKNLVTLKDVQKASERPGDSVLLVDARTRTEWERERIPSSVNMALTQVSGNPQQRDPRLESFRTIIVYGQDPGSGTARALAKKMMAAGFRDVRFFPGGVSEWQKAGQPVRSTAPAPEK
jgi:rhodanese-related sulfurtransferase